VGTSKKKGANGHEVGKSSRREASLTRGRKKWGKQQILSQETSRGWDKSEKGASKKESGALGGRCAQNILIEDN